MYTKLHGRRRPVSKSDVNNHHRQRADRGNITKYYSPFRVTSNHLSGDHMYISARVITTTVNVALPKKKAASLAVARSR